MRRRMLFNKTENELYLYNYGDENVEVTGGIIGKIIEKTIPMTVTKLSDHIHLDFHYTSKNQFMINMLTSNNPIDLTPYSKLYIIWRGSISNENTSYSSINANVVYPQDLQRTPCPVIQGKSIGASWEGKRNDSVDLQEQIVDISSINEPCFVGIEFYSGATATLEADVYQIKLEV